VMNHDILYEGTKVRRYEGTKVPFTFVPKEGTKVTFTEDLLLCG